MNRSLRQIVEIVTGFARECDLVEGMYLMSSVVAGRDGYFSVGRAVLYLSEYEMLPAVARKIADYAGARADLQMARVADGTVALITRDMVRFDVEFSFLAGVRDDVKRFVDSGARDFRQSLVVDKQGRLEREFERYWFDRRERMGEVLDELLDGFLLEMYDFRLNATRSDEWRAYKSYVRLWELTGVMMLVASGRYKYLYNPKFLISYDAVRREGLEEFRSFQTELYTGKMMMAVRRMTQVFRKYYRKAVERWQSQDNWSRAEEFLAGLDAKFYPSVNFRDFALIVNHCEGREVLRRGKVFRSGYWGFEDKEHTRGLFERLGIIAVIDLRNGKDRGLSDERGRPFYADFVRNYFYVPLEALDFEKTAGYVGSFSPSKNNYYGIVEYQAEKVGEVLRLIADFTERGAVLVHCIAGRDRTGVVMAILQKLLGVSDECVIEDYMSTFFGVRREYIEFLLDTLENKYGGVEQWALEKAGLTRDDLNRLRSRLLV